MHSGACTEVLNSPKLALEPEFLRTCRPHKATGYFSNFDAYSVHLGSNFLNFSSLMISVTKTAQPPNTEVSRCRWRGPQNC